MARHHASLSRIGTHLATYAVGITLGDVQKLIAACGLLMSHGALYHVSQVVQLMTQVLFLLPPFASCPLVRMLRVHRARRIEIAVGFLCCRHDIEHAVYIVCQFRVGICLEQITSPLDGFIHISVIERITRHVDGVAGMGGMFEVFVTSRLLAFAESEWYRHLAAGFEPLTPELVGHSDRCERYGGDGVAVWLHNLCRCRQGGNGEQKND